MNRTKVEIMDMDSGEFTDYTDYLVNDYKEAELLDEQLDEATITLKRVNFEFLNPLTIVRITIENFPEAKFTRGYFTNLLLNSDIEINGDVADTSRDRFYSKDRKYHFEYFPQDKRILQTKTINYIVANDNAVKVLLASEVITNGQAQKVNLNNHELYLIELTKILEGFIGDSLSFTNALGNDYIGS